MTLLDIRYIERVTHRCLKFAHAKSQYGLFTHIVELFSAFADHIE